MEIWGCSENGISAFHKVWITDVEHDVVVVGYIGEGTSKEIISNWETPFVVSSLAAKYAIVLGAVNEMTGLQIASTINSRQVWAGNKPYTFNLAMKFRAFTDPLKEVEGAIRALELMTAGDPAAGGLAQRVPPVIMINFGRRQLFSDCCCSNH